MLAIEGFTPGRKYLFSVEYVLDNIAPWDGPDCWDSDSAPGCNGDCEEVFYRSLEERRMRDAWRVLLNHKRADNQYPYIVESLRLFGWREQPTVQARRLQLSPARCNTAKEYVDTKYADHATELFHGDGHHRLAAAIDLGITHIEYRMANNKRHEDVVRHDSGYEDPDSWEGTVSKKDLALLVEAVQERHFGM